jgi:glycine hydroxymethyltransferase
MMDNRITEILRREEHRQNNTIELIASENFASKEVMQLCGSIFTNKYAEGYPGKRYYNGCDHMDEIEELAISQLIDIYGCLFANVQPHSGANANLAIFKAFLKPGDRVFGMDLASGGHLSHGAKVNISGSWFQGHTYGVDADGYLDYDSIETRASMIQPKLIIAGASAYPRRIDWARFRQIADRCGAYLMVDMAHYSGLIAGKAYPNPVPYADFVTSTTHKTLRGPRGGIILWNNEEYCKKINSAIFPGTQGGPLMNIIAGKAQAFSEANTDEFIGYANQVVANAQAMAQVFVDSNFKLLTGGTDSHILLLDLSDSKHSGREAADLLEENGITVNKNGVPNDPRSFVETSGIRIGTAAETTRGRDAEWFKQLAERIVEILK